MKIGLACCGSGPGAKHAAVLAETLAELSIKPDMISCSSLTCAPLLLWSRGMETEEIARRIEIMLLQQASTAAIEAFCKGIGEKSSCHIAINSVDCESGAAIVWTDELCSTAWNWQLHPLSGAETLALQCAMCCYGLPISHGTQKLTDFSCRYGCPFFPLRMAGVERILSVVFTGGEDAQECAGEYLSVLTGKKADLHYTLHLSANATNEDIKSFIFANRSELYSKLLF